MCLSSWPCVAYISFSLTVTLSTIQVLFEEEQILPDGRSRKRNVALSEKLIGGEDWRHAVDRAVQEELGSILPNGYKVKSGIKA